MDRLSESLWQEPPTLGDRELKYDGISKKWDKGFGKGNEFLEGRANLWCWDTRGSAYKEKDFSVAVCNCPHTYDTHIENS